jgi:hypothetical protein
MFAVPLNRGSSASTQNRASIVLEISQANTFREYQSMISTLIGRLPESVAR